MMHKWVGFVLAFVLSLSKLWGADGLQRIDLQNQSFPLNISTKGEYALTNDFQEIPESKGIENKDPFLIREKISQYLCFTFAVNPTNELRYLQFASNIHRTKLYQWSGGEWEEVKRVKHNLTNTYQLSTNQSVEKYCLSIEVMGKTTRTPLEILDIEAFMFRNYLSVNFNGFFYGLIITLVIIFLFHSITFRDLHFFLFMGFSIVSIIMWSFLDGFWVNKIGNSQTYDFIILTLVRIYFSLFLYLIGRLTGVRSKSRRLYMLMQGTVIYMLVLVPLLQLLIPGNYNYVFHAIIQVDPFVCVSLLIFMIRLTRKTNLLYYRSFLAALLIYLLSLGIDIGNLYMRVLPTNPLFLPVVKMGTLSLLSICAFTMISEFKKMQKLAEETQRELEQLVKQTLKMKNLGLQQLLNPHLFFNALGNIRDFFSERQYSKGIQATNLLKNILNTCSVHLQEEYILLKEEVQFLENYIELVRFQKSYPFRFEVDVAAGLRENILIPPMIIQPHIENAFKHGRFYEMDEMPIIRLQIRSKNRELQVSIYDNGLGVEASSSTQLLHSSDIINRRFALFEEKFEAPFRISRDYSRGGKVEICIPFIYRE